MAKYCIHCGRKLEDGEVCTCQIKQQEERKNDFLDIVKGMFIKPIDTIKKYTMDKYFKIGLILIGILSIAVALFVLSLVSNVTINVVGVHYSFTVPFLQIFLASLAGGILGSIIYIGFLYIVNGIIFKGDKSFQKYVVFYGINAVIPIVSLIIAAILMFIIPMFGLCILVLGYVLNMLYIYRGLEYLGVKDKNRHGYVYLLTALFCIVLVFIVSLILNLGGNNYNGYGNNYTANGYHDYDDFDSYYGYRR